MEGCVRLFYCWMNWLKKLGTSKPTTSYYSVYSFFLGRFLYFHLSRGKEFSMHQTTWHLNTHAKVVKDQSFVLYISLESFLLASTHIDFGDVHWVMMEELIMEWFTIFGLTPKCPRPFFVKNHSKLLVLLRSSRKRDFF